MATSRSPLRWVPTLYFAEGLPFYVVAMIAAQMFKSLSVPNEQITRWTALLGLAWVFKPLWSPLLERVAVKKKPVVAFELIGGTAMIAVALLLQTSVWFTASLMLLGVIAVAAATHDIAADGLYIASLSRRQQALYAGWQGAFFNAARFVALGGLLILAGMMEQRIGVSGAWSVIFALAGLALAGLAAYHAVVLPAASPVAVAPALDPRSAEFPAARSDAPMTSAPGPSGKPAAPPVWTLFVLVLRDFLKKPGILFFIAFIVLFRAGEGQIQSIGPLFLRESRDLGGLGLSTDQVGWVYGTFGTLAFLVGSVLGGYFAARLGLKRALPWLILILNLPNAVFWYLSRNQPDDLATIASALGLEMFGYGFGFVGVILFIMQVVAVGKYQTAHYSLGTGIMQLGLVLFKAISGDLQHWLGYQTFFLWVLISAAPVLAMSLFVRIPEPARPSSDPALGAAGDDLTDPRQ